MANLKSQYWTSQPGEQPTKLEKFLAALSLTNQSEEYDKLKKRVQTNYMSDNDALVEHRQLVAELGSMDAETVNNIKVLTRDLDFSYTSAQTEFLYKLLTDADNKLDPSKGTLFQKFVTALGEGLDEDFETAFAFYLMATNSIPEKQEALKFTDGIVFGIVYTLDFINNHMHFSLEEMKPILRTFSNSEVTLAFCQDRYQQSLLSATPEEIAKTKSMEAGIEEMYPSQDIVQQDDRRQDWVCLQEYVEHKCQVSAKSAANISKLSGKWHMLKILCAASWKAGALEALPHLILRQIFKKKIDPEKAHENTKGIIEYVLCATGFHVSDNYPLLDGSLIMNRQNNLVYFDTLQIDRFLKKKIQGSNNPYDIVAGEIWGSIKRALDGLPHYNASLLYLEGGQNIPSIELDKEKKLEILEWINGCGKKILGKSFNLALKGTSSPSQDQKPQPPRPAP